MISSIFISSPRGDIILFRTYKDDISLQDVSEFVQWLILTDNYKHHPIIRYRRWVYSKVTLGSLTLYTAVRRNGNVIESLNCLYELRDYISILLGDNISSKAMFDKIIPIYEILDEVVDGGCIQNTEKIALASFSLSEYSARLLLDNDSFTQSCHPVPSEVSNFPIDISSVTIDLPTVTTPKQLESPLFAPKEDLYESFNQTYLAATSDAILKGADFKYPGNLSSFSLLGNIKTNSVNLNLGTAMATGEMIPWRMYGLNYKRNDVSLTVTEVLNVYYGLSGSLLDSYVIGTLEVDSSISGSPELALGANFLVGNTLYDVACKHSTKEFPPLDTARNYTSFEHVNFHKSVKLDSAYNGFISFTPPDGKFTLLKYRSSDKIFQPMNVTAVLYKRSTIHFDYSISIKWLLGKKLTGTRFLAVLPIPPNAKKVDLYNTSTGKAKPERSRNAVEWTIKKISGEQDLTLRCGVHFSISTLGPQWKQPPLQISFEIASYAPTGINIKTLDSSDKLGLKLNRYITYNTTVNYYVPIRF